MKNLKHLKKFNESEEKSNVSDVRTRLYAVVTEDAFILQLFWKEEDAVKELEVYEREYKGAKFFVEEVEVY